MILKLKILILGKCQVVENKKNIKSVIRIPININNQNKFYLLKKFTAYQLMFLRPIWFALFSLILVLTLDGDFSFMNKITKKDMGILILAVFLNVITLVMFFTLLKTISILVNLIR